MRKVVVSSFIALTMLATGMAWGDAYVIDFNLVMNHVWMSPIWNAVKTQFNVLPADFTLAPSKCDINGGFDISVTPVVFFPNNMLDSDEYALVAAILANPSFDCSATGGTSHTQVHNAWNKNFAQVWHDLGGGVGGVQRLLPPNSMIADVEYLFCIMMTLGDQDTVAFPLMIMNLVVNNALVRSLFNDPNLHVPDPTNYALLYPWLGWCGDADGDGCSNLNEYLHYKPLGGRTAYLEAALDPGVKPPGCSDDRVCDGTGGLLGEYFSTRFMSNLTAIRKDPQVSFDWSDGAPHPEIAANNFSIRWTGFVVPDYSEDYTFLVRTDDGVRLWVNDELLVDKWNDHGPTTYSSITPVPLEAGHAYPIRMEFYENGGGAMAWLGWEGANQTNGEQKAIYEMNLVPGTGMGDLSKDWIRNPANGHYYKLTDSMDWNAANAVAGQWGGYLTTVNDAAENEWLRLTFTSMSGGVIYTGANDIQTEGQWVWAENGANFYNGVTNTGVVVAPWYTNWACHDESGTITYTEPNDSGGHEDAGMIYSDGYWNDLTATEQRFGVVEVNTGRINITPPSPSAVTVVDGKRFTVSVEVRHPYGVVHYQWYKDGGKIEGATEATYTIDEVGFIHAGNYTCVVTDESLAIDESPGVKMTVVERLPLLGTLPLTGLAVLLAGLGAWRRQRTATC